VVADVDLDEDGAGLGLGAAAIQKRPAHAQAEPLLPLLPGLGRLLLLRADSTASSFPPYGGADVEGEPVDPQHPSVPNSSFDGSHTWKISRSIGSPEVHRLHLEPPAAGQPQHGRERDLVRVGLVVGCNLEVRVAERLAREVVHNVETEGDGS